VPYKQAMRAGPDGARLWDPATGEPPAHPGRPTSWVDGVAFSLDGRLLAGDGIDGVRLWDPATGEPPRTLVGHTSWVGGSGASRPGILAGCNGMGQHRVRRGRLAALLATVFTIYGVVKYGPVELGRDEGTVRAVAVLPDGRVVTGGDDDRPRLWDVRSSSPGSLLACSAYALATAPSPSGARLFIGHARGGISCWEVRATAQNTPGARQRAGNGMQQQA
jgi:WD40 repeat protein